MPDREPPRHSIESVDAVLDRLGGAEMGAMRCEPRKLKTGEHKLAAKVLQLALEDAERPNECATRRDARAWLRDSAAIYSARVCFEALGIDYDAAIEKLRNQWRAVQ